jgi:predicted ATPase
MPVYDKERSVLPVAAIYGANASGKSNLLDGLRFMAEAVRDSFGQWGPGAGVPRRPFRLDRRAGERPSVFVVEIVEGGLRYTYGFEVDDRRVLAEWLYSYPKKRRRLLFERTLDDVRIVSGLSHERAKLEVLKELLRPNSLFLSLAAQSNDEALLPVYRWFVDGLDFRLAGDPANLGRELSTFLRGNEELRDRFVELVRVADFGISDIGLGGGSVDDPEADERATAERRRVRLAHGDEFFELAEESAGTRSWLGLLPSVLGVLRGGGVLVIDEIDASLHSLLSARLVGLFNDPAANPGGGQLIFTTHDATLLHPPLAAEVLDRDEVWFVEKGQDGASQLYPLTDFKPRREDNLERRYLAGQYGAVPQVYEELFARALRGGSDDGEA